jgi:hypothetical protein
LIRTGFGKNYIINAVKIYPKKKKTAFIEIGSEIKRK